MSDVAGYLGSEVDESNPWEGRVARIDEVVNAADDMAVKNMVYAMAMHLPRSIVKEGDEARRSKLVFGFALDSYVQDAARQAAAGALVAASDDLATAIGEHTHDT